MPLQKLNVARPLLWLTFIGNEKSHFILQVWTPNVITIWEALLTVLHYGLLLTHAYAQDKRWPYFSLPMYVFSFLFFFIMKIVFPIGFLCSIILLLILFVIQSARSERPEEWVPEEAPLCKHENNVCECCEILPAGETENRNIVDVFSIHSSDGTGTLYCCITCISVVLVGPLSYFSNLLLQCA